MKAQIYKYIMYVYCKRIWSLYYYIVVYYTVAILSNLRLDFLQYCVIFHSGLYLISYKG